MIFTFKTKGACKLRKLHSNRYLKWRSMIGCSLNSMRLSALIICFTWAPPSTIWGGGLDSIWRRAMCQGTNMMLHWWQLHSLLLYCMWTNLNKLCAHFFQNVSHNFSKIKRNPMEKWINASETMNKRWSLLSH